jgi:hypothetical protein
VLKDTRGTRNNKNRKNIYFGENGGKLPDKRTLSQKRK